MSGEGTGSPALWELVEAGGCARKLPADALLGLAPWLGWSAEHFMEDAATVTLGAERAVQTVDFITPVAPDAGDFGRIAAANALSDIFVLGARPVSALAIACVPPGDSVSAFARALEAARAYLADEGCALVGGHSVSDSEPKLGFAILGTPGLSGRLLAAEAIPHDILILTKPIGVGLVSSAYKSGLATDSEMAAAVAVMTASNSCVARLLDSPVASFLHAATDVSGFGLFAHLGEMCRRSRVGAIIEMNALPLVGGARRFAEANVRTSAHSANTAYALGTFAGQFTSLLDVEIALLVDPQTSGGAVMAVDPNAVDEVCQILTEWGVLAARVGEISSDPFMVVI